VEKVFLSFVFTQKDPAGNIHFKNGRFSVILLHELFLQL